MKSLNLNKLKERLNRHKNKAQKKSGNKNVSPFFTLQEGTNRFRLVAWPDSEEEDGERIPDFKELSFYYDVKFPEKDENGNIKKDSYGKQIWHKPPLSNKFFGEEDIIAETMSDLFKKDGKSEQEIKDDKEIAMLLWPTPTWYLLGIDRSKEDEGLKIWTITSKAQYETLLNLFLDDRKGPMVLDMSEEGHDLEIVVTMSEDGKGGKKRTISSTNPDFDSSPLHAEEEMCEKIMNDQDFPDPMKIFKKRKKTPEELKEHFNRWLETLPDGESDVSTTAGTEHTPAEEPAKEEKTEEVAEVKEKAPAKKKASKKASKKVETVTIEDAFGDIDSDDDED